MVEQASDNRLLAVDSEQEVEVSAWIEFAYIQQWVTFGNFQRLLLVRHQHKRRPEDDDVELVAHLLRQVIEVHFSNLHVGAVREYLFAGWQVVGIDVYPQDPGGAGEAVHNTVQRLTGCSAYIQHMLGLAGQLPNFIPDTLVRGSTLNTSVLGVKLAVDVFVDECRHE